MPHGDKHDPFEGTAYMKVDDLGGGSYGSVKLARHKEHGYYVAIKMLERGAKISKNLKHVKRELCNHRRLAHNHVIRFIEAFSTDCHLCIVMEHAAGGNLHDYIKQYPREYRKLYNQELSQQGLGEGAARWFFCQLIVAVDYCHRQGICNRDIKLRNTLITHTARETFVNSNFPMLKVCDFGFSKDYAASCPNTAVGTPHYMAPEVIKCCDEDGTGYDGKAVDVWSCGVMLYCMLFNRFPFGSRGDNAMDVVERIRKLYEKRINFEIPAADAASVSPQCVELLHKMLRTDPTERVTTAGIFEDPWFRECCDPQKLQEDAEQPGGYLQSEEELENLVDACKVALV